MPSPPHRRHHATRRPRPIGDRTALAALARLSGLAVALHGCGDATLFADGVAVDPTSPSTGDASDAGDAGDASEPGVGDRGSHDALRSPRDGDPESAPDSPDDGTAGSPDDGTAGSLEDAGAAPRPDAAAPQDAALPPPPPPPPDGPPLYPADRDHSPLTPALAARMRAVAARAERVEDVFAKIGDSITVSDGFLHCFSGDNVRLDGRDELQDTLDYFRGGDAAGSSPFGRQSEAAVVGWSVQSALRGAPSPVDRELAVLNPRLAVVMFGTNDIENDNLSFYGDHMRTLVDLLLGQGVVPLLSTLPPRDDKPASDAEVPTYNTILRALAQSRGIPLIDLHRRMLSLAGHGLGGDHLHPRSAGSGACDFTAAGLQGGYNLRNLLTLEALDRARHVLAGGEAPDAAGPVCLGSGTAEDPIIVDTLPFADARDTHAAPQSALGQYPGCGSAADEGGGEFVYRLELAAQTTVRIDLVDGDGVDLDLHLVVDPHDPATCLQRHDRQLVADLAAGTWYVVADTFVAAGAPQPGEYLLAIVAE